MPGGKGKFNPSVARSGFGGVIGFNQRATFAVAVGLNGIRVNPAGG